MPLFGIHSRPTVTACGNAYFMTKIRRGNYVFLSWKGDHAPKHVHVYKDRKLVVKWNLEAWLPISGAADAQVQRLLRALVRDGKL